MNENYFSSNADKESIKIRLELTPQICTVEKTAVPFFHQQQAALSCLSCPYWNTVLLVRAITAEVIMWLFWRPGKAGVGCKDTVLRNVLLVKIWVTVASFVKLFKICPRNAVLKTSGSTEGEMQLSFDLSYRIWLLEWLNALCHFLLSFSLFSFS